MPIDYISYPDFKFIDSFFTNHIPSHWETWKIGHFATIKSGDAISSDQIRTHGPYPVYGGNGKRGYFTKHNLHGDHLLIGRQGALCGNIHVATKKFWATEHALVLSLTKKVNLHFLSFLLQAINLNQLSISAAQPGLTATTIANLTVALPTIQEQDGISFFLGHETTIIDNLIKKQQQLIALLQEKRQATIDQAVTKGVYKRLPEDIFNASSSARISENQKPKKSTSQSSKTIDWRNIRLKYFAQVNPSKPNLNQLPDDYEVTFLPMEAIGTNGALDTSRQRPLREVRNGYTYLRENDICIAKITPCFENNKGAIAKDLVNHTAAATTEVIPIRTKKIEDTPYLYYLLSSYAFRKTGEGFMTGAGGQKRIPESYVGNYSISLPSPKDRKDIANYLNSKTITLDTLLTRVHSFLNLLKERRAALISAAVTGQIDVRNWQPPESPEANNEDQA